MPSKRSHHGNQQNTRTRLGGIYPARIEVGAALASTEQESQPLLVRHEDDLESGTLLEGSSVTIAEVAEDVQAALTKHPREAVKWIEDFGCTRLGAFRVQASKIATLQEKDSLLTLGADRKDIDWKAVWLEALMAGNCENSGIDHSALMEVEAFVVDIKNPAGADTEGIVNQIIHNYQHNLCGVRAFSFPAVRAVLTHKWQVWARSFLAAEVSCYVVWLVSFQIFVLLVQDEDSHATLAQIAKSPRGICTVAFEALSFLGMLPFVFIEVCTLREYGWWDWLTAWNSLDVISYSVQLAVCVMHVGRWGIHSDSFSVLAALQVLLLWLRVQYFARCVQPTKNPFMETLRAVINDVKWFLALLLLTLWGFSCSFYILFRKDQEKQEFRTIWMSLSTMFSTMMGGFDLMLYANSHNPVVATGLLLVFVFCMSMVLLNCLIAIMCDACAKVVDTEGTIFLLARAQIIDELETTIPRSWRAPAWYPNYIHFLQVNREHALLQEVGGEGEEEEEGKDGDVAQRLAVLEARLEASQQQLETVLKLQEGLVRAMLAPRQVEEVLQAARLGNPQPPAAAS